MIHSSALAVMGLIPGILGQWNGSCHVSKDQIFNLPPVFSDQLKIDAQENLILSSHQVMPDPTVAKDEADKLTELMMIFVQGPADLSTGDSNFHYFQYTTKPGDTPPGVWNGYTMNNAILDAAGDRFTIQNLCVLGNDGQVVFNTTAQVVFSKDSDLLTLHAETSEAQSNSHNEMSLDCAYKKTK